MMVWQPGARGTPSSIMCKYCTQIPGQSRGEAHSVNDIVQYVIS